MLTVQTVKVLKEFLMTNRISLVIILLKYTFVNLSIYSMSPLQLKKTLINEPQYAGNYQILWGYTDDNGDTVSTGYYKRVLLASGQTYTKLFYLE